MSLQHERGRHQQRARPDHAPSARRAGNGYAADVRPVPAIAQGDDHGRAVRAGLGVGALPGLQRKAGGEVMVSTRLGVAPEKRIHRPPAVVVFSGGLW